MPIARERTPPLFFLRKVPFAIVHHFFERQLPIALESSGSVHQHWRRLLLRGLLAAAAVTLVIFLVRTLETDIPSIESWVRAQGAWMPIVFSAIFLLAVLLWIPADIFAFVAGTLFGLWWGFLITVVVEYIALIAEFYLARSLLKKRVEQFLNRHTRFRAIDNAISKDGLRISFLLRLGPIPLTPLNYVLGMSRVDFRTYMLSSVGMLPSLLPIVYYGTVARHLTDYATGAEHHSWIHYAAMIGAALVCMFATVYITRVANKALKEANAI